MLALTIRPISERLELEQAYAVLKELRTGLSQEDFFMVYDEAHKQSNYKIVAALYEFKSMPLALQEQWPHGQFLAVMGYRILTDYVHGRHVYIDDLVSHKDFRSQGLGTKLLEYAEEEARRQRCRGLRLSTGVDNKDAMRFYEREGWLMRSVSYKKKLV